MIQKSDTQKTGTNETKTPQSWHFSVAPTRTTTTLGADEITLAPTETLPDRLLNFEELALYTGFDSKTWYNRNSRKEMPFKVVYLGKRCPRVWLSSVNAWIAAQAQKHIDPRKQQRSKPQGGYHEK